MMISKHIKAVFITVIISAAGLAGCVETTATRTQRASDTADMATIRNDLNRLRTEVTLLREQMDAFTSSQQDNMIRVTATAQKTEASVASLRKEMRDEMDSKISEMEKRQARINSQLDAKIEGAVKEVRDLLRKMTTSSGTGTTTTTTGGGTEKGFYHTVVANDTVWGIAQKYKEQYGTTTDEILRANGLKSGDPIHPGQKLFIPVKE